VIMAIHVVLNDFTQKELRGHMYMRASVGILFSLLATAAHANDVDCLFEVRGATYLDGVCNGEFPQGGSFTLGTGGQISGQYFVSVKRNPDGTATAYWNGGPGRNSADYPLGKLTRLGACWVGEQTRVCAWKIGEERWFTDQPPPMPRRMPTDAQPADVKLANTQIGAWTVAKNLHDATSGAIVAAAVLTNAEGYRLTLFRSSIDRRVQIGLLLPRGSFEQIIKVGRVAAYKLDDKDVEFLDTTGVGGYATQTLSTGQTVTSVVFHGEGPIPSTGALSDILNANHMVVRFYTGQGSYLEAAFDLTGVDRAVQAALF
jgi:hypothetical protein